MKSSNCFSADFETTTDENDCRVWAWALCNVDDYNKFEYGNSLDSFFDFCRNKKQNYKMWFHNLKFDGTYIIDYLLKHDYTWISSPNDKADKTFTTLITDMGQYYSITVYFNVNKHSVNKVEFLDSLKIFPNLSVENIAQSFKLPISKLSIDYDEKREIGHELTEEELAYIRNDVEIVARALKEMFSRNLTKMTIASDALNYFKDNFKGFRRKFPILPKVVDADIRKSYRGGFTYVNDTWVNKETPGGVVLDVNSLYPSCMSSPYLIPYGQPVLYEGKYEEDKEYPLYVQSLSCSFDLKEGKIPSIQIKNHLSFIPNEYVKTSHGEEVNLYLTKPDLELFKEQYNIYHVNYHGGWKFKGSAGFFDDYIDYWIQQKIQATKEGNAPLRSISKLLLNALYGKLGSAVTTRQKAPYLKDGVVKFSPLSYEDKEPLWVAGAAYITSYGRNKTIRTSQAIKDYTLNKYGEDRYYYSDTDSIHANLSPEDIEDLKDIILIDDYKLGYWAKEAEFTRAKYIRQKCYIEEIDGKLEVKVAGLPKYLTPIINFNNFTKGFSTEGITRERLVQMAKENGASLEEIEKIHHKMQYKYVQGGVVFKDTGFTIK